MVESGVDFSDPAVTSKIVAEFAGCELNIEELLDASAAGPSSAVSTSNEKGRRAMTPPTSIKSGESRRLTLCYLLAALWFGAFLLSKYLFPTAALAVIQGLLLIVFLLPLVVVHSSLSYGWIGSAAFFLITIIVSFLLEASSIASGFPFGFYVHNVSSLRLLGVPLPVPLGYFVLGWFGWTLARVIVRDVPGNTSLQYRFTTPLIATFILAGSDLVADPIGASVKHLVTYRHPSGLFGVPLTNFLGWLFTGWVFFQLFALIEPWFRPNIVVGRRGYWLMPAVIWCAMAARYCMMFVQAPAGTIETGGRTFVAADIYETTVILSLFTHVLFGLLASIKTFDLPTNTNGSCHDASIV